MLHSNILPLLVLDIIAVGSPGPSLAATVSWTNGFTIVYAAFLLYVNVHYGMWPYRFMHGWSVTYYRRVFLMAIPGTLVLAAGLYALRRCLGMVRGGKQGHLKQA
jgi:hypothetical protein